MPRLLAAGLLALTSATLFGAATIEGCARTGPEHDGLVQAALADDGGGVPSRGSLVISQVYGGGGTGGATFDHDFVEVLNKSAGPLSLNGLSLQVANAQDDFGSAGGSIVALSGTIGPSQYVLVALGADAVGDGAPLPASDLSGDVDLGTTAGKIALAPSTDPLACGSSVGSRCAATKALDIVGYGLVSDFEGTQPVTPLSNTTAAIRSGKGCTDANDNRGDFTVDTPTPRNTASPAAGCPPPTSKPPAEAGGPPPPVVDPPLPPEVGGDDAGTAARDAGTHAPGAAAAGCSLGVVGQGSLVARSAIVGLAIAFVAFRRRRRASEAG